MKQEKKGAMEDGAELVLDGSLHDAEDGNVGTDEGAEHDLDGDDAAVTEEDEAAEEEITLDTEETDASPESEESDVDAVEGEEDDEFDFDSAIAEALGEDDADEESDVKSEENTESEEDGALPVDADTGDGTPTQPQEEMVDNSSAEHEESADVRELRELREKYDKLERRSKDALKSLGIEDGDVVAGLERLGAEQSDKTLEEYREDLKKRDDAEAEKRRADAEKKSRDRAELIAAIDAMKKADIEAIHAAYPASAKYTTVDELPNSVRFKALRDGGASPVEAYAATNAAEIAADAAAHRDALQKSKSHLTSVVGKSAGGSVKMSASDYRMARSILGDDVSDAELARIYKKVTK